MFQFCKYLIQYCTNSIQNMNASHFCTISEKLWLEYKLFSCFYMALFVFMNCADSFIILNN